MNRRSATRNRSEIVTLTTPRGPIDVVWQERRGVRTGSGWRGVWLARRKGQREFRDGTTAAEAIRKAALLKAGKPPAWLTTAAAEAEAQIASTPSPDNDSGSE